jgi:GT2 family glycosyltransferase
MEGVRFGPFNKSLLMNNNYIDLNCFVHKTKITNFNGRFDVNLPRFVDWEFISRLSNVGSICSIPVILSNYNLGLADNTITGNSKLIDYLDIARNIIKKNEYDERKLTHAITKGGNLKISAVIPSFNALDDLIECIASLKQYIDCSGFELIVVDNASSVDVIEYLESCVSQNPSKVKLLKLDRNYGYTYAVNRGIEMASKDNDVLLLNNDAVITNGSLELLRRSLYSNDAYGIAAPAQILPANTETISVHVPYAVADVEVDVNVSSHHKNLKNIPVFYDGSPLVLDFVPFFCVLIKRSTINLASQLDQRNGRHYRSDRTYCSYIKSMFGLQLVYVPQSIVYHKLQRSTKQLHSSNDKKSSFEFDLIFKQNTWSDSDQVNEEFKVAAWNKEF